ncbi:Beta-barrel assembly-enhancing protease [Kordia antarctica]|uniref:Beta-barrel assembly-enhancing protease n=1 Tax=Kordia antarctica TaxID=1218801 RepID=A0A7L4ZLH2_9FLAO|nr:tetratricopeptide repeat protein [Kordia antarctica]QHI37351.1 Beta-barrel assembly-enhancing protease [Kordia antarctica]
MESKSHLRGAQLFELGRFKEAIPVLNQAISESVYNYASKYYLALCFFNIDAYDKSSKIIDELLQESPNEGNLFFIKAQIASRLDKTSEALNLINQSIALDPYQADYFAFKGALLMANKKFEPALDFVNQGLQLDPKNAACLNLRARLLTKLNRKEEAQETVEHILYDNAEDDYAHANVGWVALENGNTKKALHHFKQALQLNPNMQYAREGMTTALKSKNFLYKWYLKYAFWMSNQSSRNQWIFIIGLYIAYRIGIVVLQASDLTFLVIPLVIVYLLFVLGGWIMEPLSNTILLADSYGKYLLQDRQKYSGYAFGGLALAGILAVGAYFTFGNELYMLWGLTFFCALLPLPGSFLREQKRTRLIGLFYGIAMICVGFFGVFFTNDIMLNGAIVLGMMVVYTWISGFIS